MKPTLAIGIAAYNEEKNIERLLNRLIGLKIQKAQLKEIIVITDGSTDNTLREVKKVRSNLITSLHHADRKGKSARLNELCKKSNTSILVMLDADISMLDDKCIDKLIAPIVKHTADLTSCTVKELPTKTFLGSVLVQSMNFKRKLFSSLHAGDNIYTCHGRARALSKKLYKKLDFNIYLADDAYSYLFAKKQKMLYTYVSETSVFYRIPEVLSDHVKQSVRFYSSQKEFFKEFGKSKVTATYKIPRRALLSHVGRSFLVHPIQTSAYFSVALISKLSSRKTQATWGTAYSTK